MESVRCSAGASTDSEALGRKLLYTRHDPLRIPSMLNIYNGDSPRWYDV